MTNEEAIQVLHHIVQVADTSDCGIKEIDGLDEEALDMAIKALETISKYKDAYNKGWDDGAKATYEHLKMCEEEQEPKYCDRNICISNEYNGIGCDECEVTKSQKQKTEKVIKMRDATPEEREAIDKYINSMSKLTGVDFWDSEQEPKTGHWIANAPQYDMFNPQYICSECGNAHTRTTPYCEMCGARMESEDNNGG